MPAIPATWETDRKIWESLELPRDLLNVVTKMLIVIWTIKSRLKLFQMELRKLTGNWSKGHFWYASAKRLVALCPCSRDLWNFELKKDDAGRGGSSL